MSASYQNMFENQATLVRTSQIYETETKNLNTVAGVQQVEQKKVQETATDMHQSNSKIEVWKQTFQSQKENLQAKLTESEGICQRQYQNMLESQATLARISQRYETELKNKNNLIAGVQQVRNDCQFLQEQYKVLTGALHRMFSVRDRLKETVLSDKKKCRQCEEQLNIVNNKHGHIMVNLTYSLDELHINHETEKKHHNETQEKSKANIKTQFEELNSNILLIDKELENYEVKHTMTEKFQNADQNMLQFSQQKSIFLESKENQLMESKDSADQLLQDIIGKNSEMEMIAQQNPNLETELAVTDNNCLNLNELHNDLLKELESIQSTLLVKEPSLSNIRQENMNSIRDIKDQEVSIRRELEFVKSSANSEIKEFEKKIHDVENSSVTKLCHCDTILMQSNELQSDIHYGNNTLTSARNTEKDLNGEIEHQNDDFAYKKGHFEDLNRKVESVLAHFQEKHTLMQNDLTKMQEAYNEKEIEVMEIMEKISCAKEISALLEVRCSKLETEIYNFEIAYEEAKNKVDEQEGCIKDNLNLLLSQQHDAEALLNSIASDKDLHDKLKLSLNEEFTLLQTNSQENQDSLCRVKHIIADIQDECAHLKYDTDLLLSSVKQKEEINKSLEIKLSEEAQTFYDNNEALKSEVSTAKSKIMKLSNDKNQRMNTIADIDEKLLEQNSFIKSSEEGINGDEKLMQELQREKQSLTEESKKAIMALNSNLETLNMGINCNETEYQVAKSKIVDLGKEMNDMEKKLVDYESLVLTQTGKAIQVNATIKELTVCIREKEAIHMQSVQEVSQLSCTLQDVESKMKTARTDCQEQMEALAADLKRAKNVCQVKFNEIRTLSQNLSESRISISKRQSTLNESKDEISKRMEKDSVLERAHKEMLAKKELTKNQHLQSQTDLKRIRGEMSKLRKFQENFQKSVAAARLGKKKLPTHGNSAVYQKECSKTASTPVSVSTNITPCSTPNRSKTPTSKQSCERASTPQMTPISETAHITPRSILKLTTFPTPQRSNKSVSFSLDSNSESSISNKTKENASNYSWPVGENLQK